MTVTFRGVHTALITPMGADGRVDLAAAERLIERQLAAGVHGLVPNGTTGETPTLSPEEQAWHTKTCVRLAAGRVPVTVGCGTNDTRTTVQTVEAAASLGASAALVVFPYYNKPTAAGLRAHVKEVVKPGLPIVLYHVPGRTGQRLPVELLGELCETPGVVAVKEATGDLLYTQDLLELTRASVLSGDDFTFAPLCFMGGHGVISVLSNLCPEMTVAWYEAATKGDAQTAQQLRIRLQPIVRGLFAESNPVPIKAALAQMGLCEPHLRLPLLASRWPANLTLEGLR